MKSCYCFLKKFNNYFNRKIIRYDDLDDYLDHADDYYIPLNENSEMTLFDFNPNDNVTTEIIANDLPFFADYFLNLDSEGNILSRWFVIKESRNRKGQWLYSLRRDVISDNINSLIDAPIFIHKANLPDGDPFTLNSEGMSLNEIKKSETLLKDKSKSAWIVGYVARDAVLNNVNITLQAIESISFSKVASDSGISEPLLASLLNTDGQQTNMTHVASKGKYALVYEEYGIFNPRRLCYIEVNLDNGLSACTSDSITSEPIILCKETEASSNTGISLPNRLRNSINVSQLISELPSMMNMSGSLINVNQFNKLLSYQNTPISYLGKYYYLRIVTREQKTYVGIEDALYTDYTNTTSMINGAVTGGWITLTSNPRFNSFQAVCSDVFIMFDEVSKTDLSSSYDASLSASRNKIERQSYDMFAIPAGSIQFIEKETDMSQYGLWRQTIDIAQEIASAIALDNDAKVYDVQLLPYCPVFNMLDKFYGNSIIWNMEHLTENVDFDYIYGPNDQILYLEHYAEVGHDGVTWSGMSPTYTINNIQIQLSNPPAEIDAGEIEVEILNDGGVTGTTITNRAIATSLDAATNILTVTITLTTAGAGNVSGYHAKLKVKYKEDRGPVSIIFYPKTASFQGTITVGLVNEENQKMESNCNKYRLVSPNYSGAFEFNLAYNGGSCSEIRYYCTYKPYTPFIKLTPDFNLLYGADFNDNRGLVCGGDFSISRSSSAWQTYQLENKNYQNIFNRDIQNMDFSMALETRIQTITGGLGIFSDTIKGGVGGALSTGSPYGAIAGAVVGGAASGLGYAMDLQNLESAHREQRQYTVDKYNFMLGNVKALPQTLTKVGTFDISSKIFPFLEFYTCTDEEKEALRNKLKYESMTVMRIGKFGEYYHQNIDISFFKGELIRCDDISEDYNVLSAIYNELVKGVFM